MTAKSKKHGYQGAMKRHRVLKRLMKKRGFLYRLAEIKAESGDRVGDADRLMRRIVRGMKRDGYRIGSHSEYGYFVVKTKKDLDLSIAQRDKQKRALGESIAWERRNFQNKNQLRLFKKKAA